MPASKNGSGTANVDSVRFVIGEKCFIGGLDVLGLEPLDRRYLNLIIDHFSGGPVGIQNMAVSLGEEADTLEDVVEPFLIQSGLLKRTPRGREATTHAWTHLGLEMPTDRSTQQNSNPEPGPKSGQGELL